MISMSEYATRRKQIMQQLGSSGIMILPGAPVAHRNGDYSYPYRQQSDLYYLTGFTEPEAVAVLAPQRQDGEFILFNRPKNREQEIWEGIRAGQSGAREIYGADEAFSIEEIEKKLPDLLDGRSEVHYALGLNKSFDRMLMRVINRIRGKIRNGILPPLRFVDISETVHEMRLIKSAAEIDVMRKSAEISASAHTRAMRACKPGIMEYQLEAELMYEFQNQGARFPAYTSIVGGGANACVLHYVENDKPVNHGDLVLIDAGAEYQYYAADITRTFPANGTFSPEQRAIYQLVLDAQLAAITVAKPGKLWNEMQDVILKVMTQGLVDLGILKGNIDELIEKQAYQPFYMHKSGHWLGLDVHDVGRYKIQNQWRPLTEGMVLTIEPGLYISADIPGVDKRWHNIGVRIEDDVLITAKGNDILSKDVPKHIADIEQLMATAKQPCNTI